MKYLLPLFIFLSIVLSNTFGQSSEIKKVDYARTKIDVPDGYFAKSDYSINNESFSAEWLYLTNEMVEQGVGGQIFRQFEEHLKHFNSTSLEFTSNGAQFSGKKYHLKKDAKLKFRILALGAVNGQPLILNLGFKEDPSSNDRFDNLIKKFILLKN